MNIATSRALLLSVFLLPLLSAVLVNGQLPIPSRVDGFVYGQASVWGRTVIVEAFFDPLCPDSRDSWPPLKKALEHYSPHVSLVVHPFALPYHTNSFVACRALHIANKLNSSSTYPLLELFFKYQENYYNRPTYDKSMASITRDISKLATKAVGKNSFPAIISGYNNSDTDAAARISFKHGCSRAVTGTPSFFVNGMPLFDSDMDYKKWIKLIGPLLPQRL